MHAVTRAGGTCCETDMRNVALSSILRLTLVSFATPAGALEPCGVPTDFIFDNGFGAGPSVSAGDETLLSVVPDPTAVAILPDEHSSFLQPANAGDPYLFFEAARVGTTGAVVLETTNLVTFSLASGYSSPVLGSPKLFQQCASGGDPASLDDEFDENYAAPGSVLQDPTQPAGNLMMIYEGENHCRTDGAMVYNVQPYYATVGFARSSDNGVTWPAPGITPTATRYPIVGGPASKPAYDPLSITAVGDAIPSAYIKGSCLYVVYANHPAPTDSNRAIAIQIARAQLGGGDPLTFQKYLASGGGFTSPGLTGDGTNVIPFTPIGSVSATPVCTGTQYQPGLSFNEALHRFVMTMVCEVSSTAGQLGWFVSTATSLELEDWTPPQLIDNTQSTAVTPCDSDTVGTQFDGWYPSLYNLNLAPGHTGKNNVAFYLDGCNLDPTRKFKSRPVTVTPDPG